MRGAKKSKKKKHSTLCSRPSFLPDLFDLGDVERLPCAPFQPDRAHARHLPAPGVVREEDRDRVDGGELRHLERLRRPFLCGLGAQLELGGGGVGLGLGEADRGPVDEDADLARGRVGVGGLDGDGGELDGWEGGFFFLGFDRREQTGKEREREGGGERERLSRSLSSLSLSLFLSLLPCVNGMLISSCSSVSDSRKRPASSR